MLTGNGIPRPLLILLSVSSCLILMEQQESVPQKLYPTMLLWLFWETGIILIIESTFHSEANPHFRLQLSHMRFLYRSIIRLGRPL
jgi:hypothetical protein